MKFMKNYALICVVILSVAGLLLSNMCSAQATDDLTLYRTDFKGVTAKNTVTVTSYEKNGTHYVYAGGFGNIDVYSLNKDGKLTSISNHELYKNEGPARGMVADNINGSDFLFVANKHGNAIETFEILNNGSLERVALVEDTDDTYLGTAITLQVVHMTNASYLYVGGLEETPGLSGFKIHNDGKLSHVQSIEDNSEIFTDGIIGMYTHQIDGKTYLYTGGFQDNGISSFLINEDGTFENINNIGDNRTDRFLTGTYPVTGVTLGDNHYVIVGHRHHKYYKRKDFIKNQDFFYHGDAVSIFKVDQQGALVPHSVFKSDAATKLQGQTRIEVVSVTNDEALLAVGTRDDKSIQLLKLNKDGIISPSNYLETGFNIYYGLRAHQIDDQPFLIAGSFRFGLKQLVAYKVAPELADTKGKLLRHIVALKFKDGTSQKAVNEALSSFENLKNEIPEITTLEWGVNDSTEGNTKGLDYIFTLTFDDAHGREIYLFHKAHMDLVGKVGPLLADALVVDYWTKK
ncbi:Dabb family protein [Shewanella sp. 10N.286.48.B5]|uniref:Dabb family protein n=1 Tax=Shewanella sp. 10N.286.48.B5 TaxID=1880834 RepID=UPI000C82F590|nr:Dabb family protein [Shewanella sp. 10N.286.48.B5]PMH84736.1 stress protein [Shewanella sp. 10N.286.48.B5]